MFNIGQVFLFNLVLITYEALFYRKRLCMLDEIACNLHILLRMKFLNGLRGEFFLSRVFSMKSAQNLATAHNLVC